MAPPARARFTTKTIPAAWKNGKGGDHGVAGVIGSGTLDCTMLATRLAWVNITPFGHPVVPLE